MHRSILRASSSVVAVATTCIRSAASSDSPSLTHSHHIRLPLQMQRRSAHTSALFSITPLCRFDLRQHEMEKRKRRDMEKAGIDPDNEDDAPWIAPEEQQRLDEEEEQRRAELEEQRKIYLQKRAEEDAVKREKFKEFRARQVSMSRHRKKEMAEKKEEARQHREEQHQRVVSEDGAAATDGGDEAASEEAKLNQAAAGGNPMVDPK